MGFKIGIRREDKNEWEKRAPIIPEHVKELKEKYGIELIVQPSSIRAFSDNDYKKAGADLREDVNQADVIFGIKEMPSDFFKPGKTYIFFAHVIKGQKHNMPMLKKMMELGCNLIDYERIVDEHGKRLVFFGRYAGIAGMVDTLWIFGQKLKLKGIETPFSKVKQTVNYEGIDDIKKEINKIGEEIKNKGLPEEIAPVVVGFAGYGNVSRGAQEIIDILPVKEINPNELKHINENYSRKLIYKVVFKEEHMVERIEDPSKFDLQHYYKNPHEYRSIFEKYLPYLSILMNCIYWDQRYPRLVTIDYMKKNYNEDFKLQVIGDISVDIEGAIEFTKKATTPGNPVFTYNPKTDEIMDGLSLDGIPVLAVDNLPCELAKESSKYFSETLLKFIPAIAKADFSVEFDDLDLPPEIKKAVILYHGKLTPDYSYISKYL